MAPLQKAGIVDLVKSRTDDMTLAIGDGEFTCQWVQQGGSKTLPSLIIIACVKHIIMQIISWHHLCPYSRYSVLGYIRSFGDLLLWKVL